MTLITPFPLDLLDVAWSWLNEFPDANFDDYGPKNLADFESEMSRRAEAGEQTWCVENAAGEPCGMVGYLPLTPRLGSLHGICMARGKSTSEERREALRAIIEELFDAGVEKICAGFFEDNQRVQSFLQELGFIEEGWFSRHTLRHGKPLGMTQMAKFREGT